MKPSRAALATALALLLVGCTEHPTAPTPVASLQILQGSAPYLEQTLRVGQTLQLRAELKDGDGKPVDGRQVTWSSTAPTVATVDAGGLVTGVDVGVARIVAAAEGAADTVRVNVGATVSGQVACAPGDPGLSLAVGQMHTTNAYDASTLCINGGNGSEYVFIPFHASGSSASRLAMEVTGTGTVVTAGPPNPTRVAAGPSLTQALPDAAFHRELRERVSEELTPRMKALQRSGAGGALQSLSAAREPREGELLRLNVRTDSACATPRYRTGRVVAVTSRAVVVADTANPAGGFTVDEYRGFGATFDQLVHPLGVRNFGEPSDLDNNQRVIIFFTKAVNELTTPGAGYYVAGFFFDRDLFPRTGSGACGGSNAAEMFYLMVPDPSRAASEPVFRKERVQQRTIAVVGHEFQHLINASRRLHVHKATTWEETWLNEGLSHIAEELLFYEVSGLSPRRNLGAAILNDSRTREALDAYQLDNFERLIQLLNRPEESSPLAGANLAMRGAAWAFLRYAADRRGGSEQELWNRLVNSRTAGMANLREVLTASPVDWMQDWTVSLYTDDTGLDAEARHREPSWNYRELIPALGGLLGRSGLNQYPLRAVQLRPEIPHRAQLHGGSSAYLRFGVPAGARAAVRTTSGDLPAPSRLRITVLRTK